MKMKALGAAVAAALMGLSAATLAQTTPGTRGPVQGTYGQDNPAANEAPATGTSTGNAAVGTSGAGTYAACDSLTGTERDRCMRDYDRRGSNSGAYVPQRPAQNMDKNDPVHPNVKNADQERSRSQ